MSKKWKESISNTKWFGKVISIAVDFGYELGQENENEVQEHE